MECYQEIMLIEHCISDNGFTEIKWSCAKPDKKEEIITTYVNCSGATPAAGIGLIKSLNSLPATTSDMNLDSARSTDCDHARFSKTARNIEKNPEEGLGAQKVMLTFQNEAELRQTLADIVPGSVLDRPVDRLHVALHFPNDNKGFGLFDKIFRLHAGDDYGYTHGMIVSAGKGREDGYHLTLEYSTNLYTQKVRGSTAYKTADGITYIDQYFLEEKLLKLVIDDMDKRKPQYFKAGMGWHNLNNDTAGGLLTGAAHQQQLFHEYEERLDFGRRRRYTNIGRGKNDSGLYLEGAVGARAPEVIHGSVRRSSYVETGIAVSSADSRANNANAKIATHIDYQGFGDKYALRLEGSAQVEQYNDGQAPILSYSFGISLGNEEWQCGLKNIRRKNDFGAAYREFDTDKEVIADLYCSQNY